MEKLQELIFKKQKLYKNKNITNHIKILFIDIKIHQIIKKLCKEQAKIIYNKTYEIYTTMIQANFN